MISVISALLGSRLGRYALAVLFVLSIAGLSILAVFKKGQESEKMKQKARELENLRKRIKTDDEISRMSPDARRERLRKWAE